MHIAIPSDSFVTMARTKVKRVPMASAEGFQEAVNVITVAVSRFSCLGDQGDDEIHSPSLLNLPAELRVIIYESLFQGQVVIFSNGARYGRRRDAAITSLLHVCRKIYLEASVKSKIPRIPRIRTE